MQRIVIGGLAAISAAAMIFVFVTFKPYRIPTGSMIPTVDIGDRVIVNRRAKDVLRGDLITFAYPLNPKSTMMKRVAGLPCDTIEIRDKQLFVNGVRATEPYVIHDDEQVYPNRPDLPEPYRSRDHFGPYTVPAGHYFVLGDNRDKSADSRYWGTIPADSVLGRVVLVLGGRHAGRPPRPPVLASLPACRSILFAPPARPATTRAR